MKKKMLLFKTRHPKYIVDAFIKEGTVQYWRQPTRAEINFGYGEIHHCDFPLERCINKEGYPMNYFHDETGLLWHRS